LLGRLMPVVRSFISYPAGAARMPFGTFVGATTAGSGLWIALWVLLGMGAGSAYQRRFPQGGPLGWGLVGLGALGALLGWLWWRRHHAV
jgi:membrane protein DedA with SNARE-associated domain